MILTKSEIAQIRLMNDQGYKPGNIDAEGLLDTISAQEKEISQLTETLRVSKMNSRTHEERAASLDREGYTLRTTIAELTAKLDAVRRVAQRIRLTRTAWLEQHGVPISQEFVNFAIAVGELIETLDAPTKPKEARNE